MSNININLNEAIDIESCSICLDNMNNEAEIYTIENCNHKFHTKCILEMFIEGFTDLCPLCRTIISTTNTRYKDFENFKFKLLVKYSKKPKANILIKNLVKKYNDNQDKIKILRSKLNIIEKERRVLDKNDNILKKIKIIRTKIGIFQNSKVIKFKLNKKRRIPKEIKESVKKFNLEIKDIIKHNITTLKQETINLKNTDTYKTIEIINKQTLYIRKNITKYNRLSKKIKDSLLSIPFAPNF